MFDAALSFAVLLTDQPDFHGPSTKGTSHAAAQASFQV